MCVMAFSISIINEHCVYFIQLIFGLAAGFRCHFTQNSQSNVVAICKMNASRLNNNLNIKGIVHFTTECPIDVSLLSALCIVQIIPNVQIILCIIPYFCRYDCVCLHACIKISAPFSIYPFFCRFAFDNHTLRLPCSPILICVVL